MNARKLLSLAALIPLLTMVACGGGGESSGPEAAPESAAPAATAPDLSNAGNVSGTISFTGDAPAAAEIALAADPFCQAAHSDAVTTSPVLVDADGGLMNVVVHVSGGLEGYSFDVPSDVPVLNQAGCIYDPHVLAVRAGQPFAVLNSDDTLHNVNVQPADNPAFNQGQPIVGMELEKVFDNPEIGVPVRCDVHPWMSAFINVFDHPYFAISGADGAFSIDQLPPGEYTIEAWHETLGTQTMEVTVGDGEAGTADFTFAASS